MGWLIIVFPQDITCLTPPLKTGVVFGGGGRGLFIDYPPVTNELNAFEYIPIQFIEHFPVGWYLGGSSFFLPGYCISVSNYIYSTGPAFHANGSTPITSTRVFYPHPRELKSQLLPEAQSDLVWTGHTHPFC